MITAGDLAKRLSTGFAEALKGLPQEDADRTIVLHRRRECTPTCCLCQVETEVASVAILDKFGLRIEGDESEER